MWTKRLFVKQENKNLRLALEEANKEIATLKSALEHSIEGLKEKIEELDQNCIYILNTVGYSQEQESSAKLIFKEVLKRVKWTVNNIIVTNKPMTKLTEQHLLMMLKKIKRR